MRYDFFLHYGWFFQNLGKEAVRTFMHTTVQFFITVLRLQAGVGQESESSTDWAKTLKQHVAQRRSLPTTIESFDEENLDENNEVIF